MKSLFERMFRQPCTANIAPEENLATEITAFLLEAFPQFRNKLLEHLSVHDDHSTWIVSTQTQLHAPNEDWHGRIPDLTLQSEDHSRVIIVEVKIEAGPTYEQLPSYERYLIHAKASGRINEWRLATLTRWSPDRTLRTASGNVHQIRFNHLTNWIRAAVDEAAGNHAAVAQLASWWADYLLQRRWAMARLTQRHIEALKAIPELLAQVSDLVQAATDAALVDGLWEKTGKTSSGTWGEGKFIWAPTLTRKGTSGTAQVGCFFGMEGNEPSIRPVIQLHRSISPPSQLEDGWRVHDEWGGKLLWLGNVVPRVPDNAEDIWDEMKVSIDRALAMMDFPPTEQSAPIGYRAPRS